MCESVQDWNGEKGECGEWESVLDGEGGDGGRERDRDRKVGETR